MHFGKRFTLVSFIFSLFYLCSRITAIKIICRDANVTAGDDAHLFCQLIDTTEDLTSITWQRRTKEKPTDTEFLIITSDGKVEYNKFGNRVEFTGNILERNGSILLKNVTSSDDGTYTCILNIYPSGPFEREIHLAVLVPPAVSVGTDVPPVAGDTEEILATCTAADAKPKAEVSWSLGALNDSVKIQTVTVDSEGRYTVKSSLTGVASKDLNEQKVQCLVSHPGLKKELQLNYSLIIHYPPQVVYITSVGDQGETREFQCETDANPKPTNFTWSRYFPVKEPLSSGVNSTHVISLTPNSNGLYYCVVSNQYGSAVGSLYMHVLPATESRTWLTLFIILFVLVLAVGSVFAFQKCNFHQGFLLFIERLRNRRHDPVNQ